MTPLLLHVDMLFAEDVLTDVWITMLHVRSVKPVSPRYGQNQITQKCAVPFLKVPTGSVYPS